MTDIQPTGPGFTGLGIAPRLLDAIANAKYQTPTPIQHQAIPPAIEGKDLVGIAQTGTGKTLAFGIPMMQRLAAGKGRGLIIVPTRELAIQVDESIQKVGRAIALRTAVLIGGASMERQIQMLRRQPHVYIVTPGRLIDHLEQKTLNLNDIQVLILDEADRMLDMGFAPQIQRILDVVPRERQTMLFSATMPDAITKIASKYMRTPLRIEIARPGTVADHVEQEVIFIGKEAKGRLLQVILEQYRGSVLVFSRTKHGAKKIVRHLRMAHHAAAEIHSNRTLAQRRDALEGFKSGKYRVLVATDIAARGIDVTGIELVLNYDLPDNPDDYVHRIGRTGRAGMTGRAISFATFDQRSDVRTIEHVIRGTLRVKPTPALPHEDPAQSSYDRPAHTAPAGQYTGYRGQRPAARPHPRGPRPNRFRRGR